MWTGGGDEAAISRGVLQTYTETNLRYSQLAALDLFTEKNTGNNLPAQIDIFADEGDAYKFLFIAKGGGSANKTFLYQQTKALLNPDSLIDFLDEKIRTLGTAACPPYHLAVVIGGTSAELTLKTVKLAGGGDVGVLQQVHGDEAVVVRGLWVVEDPGQLFQVPGPQQVRDVLEGLGRQKRQRFGGDLQHRLALDAFRKK